MDFALNLSAKLALVWDSATIPEKEKLQKIIFPEGIVYDREKKGFRTGKVNSVFRWIADLNSISGLNEKGQNGVDSILSNYVGVAGQLSNLLIEDLAKIEAFCANESIFSKSLQPPE